ncbi:tumor necrosis factor receptor superfamily member 6 [Stegastes partitus]|uniref:Tumor necrosis factor receptor superfamily member 6-like n=1 Tax=Stegastes partitus TaxID=144197 RepID=A0A3B5AEK2_9TELE|nr:PREDICTED: tumor necrosis factor receptor superfamily member 6-like [Stegastes partitus]
MASTFHPWLIIFLFLHVSLDYFSASSEPEGSVFRGSFKEFTRRRRQGCQDGTYVHEGKTCCLCAAGQRLVKHCVDKPDDRICEHCEMHVTYNSDPNSQETCLPCTSCSQPHANLEEDSPCTPARNTKCRCKENHFCNSGTETCEICQPCTKCEHGVEKACTPTKDAVCHAKGSVNVIAAVIIPIVLVIAVVAVILYFLRKKRQRRNEQRDQAQPNDNGTAQEMQPLQVVSVEDLERLLPDIAQELGWPVMKDVAIRSGVRDSVIDACVRDNPSSTQEQTLQLLKEYVQMQGRNAPNHLIDTLQRTNRRAMAERIREIIFQSNQDGQNPSA